LPLPSSSPSWRAHFFFGPFGPSGQPDPTIIQTAPKPDFAFLWIYAVLAFLPPSIETPVMLIVPVLASRPCCCCRWFAGEGERIGRASRCSADGRRSSHVSLGIFTHLGTYTPWSPVMTAWTSDAVPPNTCINRSPARTARRAGAAEQAVPQLPLAQWSRRSARPALDAIASRMTEDQIIRQVLQGGGNMPAYGNALNPSETKALVSFLMTLRGNNLAPAVDARAS
jgi:ubiquinol-cytochrome c reductase cytochrome b subunit